MTGEDLEIQELRRELQEIVENARLCRYCAYCNADGDIEYGDLTVRMSDAEALEYYIRDEDFRDLMKTFLRRMTAAYKSGGLYCGNICCGGIED